jgi:hypothetical protein
MRPVGVNSLSFAIVTRSIPNSVPGGAGAPGGLTKNTITSAMMDNVAVAKTIATPSIILFAIPKTNPKFPFKRHINW